MDSYTELASYYDMLISDEDAQDRYLEFTKQYMQGQDILELGCGSGILANKLVNSISNVSILATDLSISMIEVAKENYESDQIQFKVMDMCENPYSNKFDTVLCYCDSLNYVIGIDNVRKVFEGAYNSLRNKGVFIFDSHALTRLKEFEEGYDESFIIDELEYSWHISIDRNYINQLLRVWDDSIVPTYFFEEHHHQEVYNPNELIEILEEIGFKVRVFTDFDIEGISDGEKQFYVCWKGE